MFRDEHMNPYTIFKRAQLLEGFRLFERRGFPFHELKERLTPEAVNPLMPQKQGAAVSRPPFSLVGGWKTAAP
jgi:hypothetical protein